MGSFRTLPRINLVAYCYKIFNYPSIHIKDFWEPFKNRVKLYLYLKGFWWCSCDKFYWTCVVLLDWTQEKVTESVTKLSKIKILEFFNFYKYTKIFFLQRDHLVLLWFNLDTISNIVSNYLSLKCRIWYDEQGWQNP